MARRPGRGLRVIAGRHRGARLETPPGKVLRPMRDQVRGALFNSLEAAGVVGGAAVLDLFAGSGSLGLEALSRGAARAVFVDNNPVCLKALRGNVDKLGEQAQATTLRHDLALGVGPLVRHGPFDLVLIHPPFALLERAPGPAEPDVTVLLTEVATRPGLLSEGARIAFETPRACYADPAVALPALDLLLRREYGRTALFVTTSNQRTRPDPQGPAASTPLADEER